MDRLGGSSRAISPRAVRLEAVNCSLMTAAASDLTQRGLSSAPQELLPELPASAAAAAVMERVEAALVARPRIRVAIFDDITSNTALRLPAAELAALCRERGVVSVVDAAHSVCSAAGGAEAAAATGSDHTPCGPVPGERQPRHAHTLRCGETAWTLAGPAPVAWRVAARCPLLAARCVLRGAGRVCGLWHLDQAYLVRAGRIEAFDTADFVVGNLHKCARVCLTTFASPLTCLAAAAAAASAPPPPPQASMGWVHTRDTASAAAAGGGGRGVRAARSRVPVRAAGAAARAGAAHRLARLRLGLPLLVHLGGGAGLLRAAGAARRDRHVLGVAPRCAPGADREIRYHGIAQV
jgi:hypothetical protein